MNVLIIEPYFTGSHAVWANGYKKYSTFNVDLLKLKGRFWKWRMHGGAITLANEFNNLDTTYDLILATDMLDLTTFLSLTRKLTSRIPIAIYFHENQLVYPWSPHDRDVAAKRDKHYGFINFSSALAADFCFFNSQYNLSSFIRALDTFLSHFPDYQELTSIENIHQKSAVLNLGLDLTRLDLDKCDKYRSPVLLWNHRWEHDKNPTEFFKAINILYEKGLKFQLVILGENFKKKPKIFEASYNKMKDIILQFGFVKNDHEYVRWLWKSNILPVTSIHDFFGASIVEALYCNCYPLLPNRLSYPELFSDKRFDSCFYESFSDLVDKLERALTEQDKYSDKNFRRTVERFSWENMAPIYDATFEKLVKNY